MPDRFKYDSQQDNDTIVQYLEALTEAFRNGELRLTQGGNEEILQPQGLIGFTVEARMKGDERKLALKFRWKEHDAPEEPDEPLTMAAGGGK